MEHPHFTTLSTRHQQIDRELNAEVRRPLPDMARLTELKKRKLRLKEQLAGL